MRSSSLLPVTLLALAVGCSASLPEDEEAETVASDVVGGRRESGFPSVGYLAAGTNARNLAGPYCAATLIGPSLAVTAAHCITMSNRAYFGIGFGSRGSSAIIPAKRVIIHPEYLVAGSYRHDVAVLVLGSAPRVQPAAIFAGQSPSGAARYVGYGRTTPGALERLDGYTGERKSAAMTITRSDALTVFTRGVDGGLCKGDSGGPLLSASGEVIGVLSGIVGEAPTCDVGNESVFVNLAGEASFMASAKACAADEGACGACKHACTTYGYVEGTCRQGWRCTAGCLVPDPC